MPKEQPRLEPKQTRRRVADAAEESMFFGNGGEGQAGDSELYEGNDDTLSVDVSGDDIDQDDDADPRRAHKRARVAA